MHYLRPCNPTGLSPRVRGGVEVFLHDFLIRRFIPACAGSGCGATGTSWRCRVYPRVCGEWNPQVIADARRDGLSPRVRGVGSVGFGLVRHVRFIPACAGRRDRTAPPGQRPRVYPRVCGEE